MPYLMPINPISATLLHTGQVLIVAGSENDAKNNAPGAESYRNAVWDPQGTTESSITVQSIDYDVFCSGTAALPDGRSLVVGGTSDYSFTGDKRASIFDPTTGRFAQSQSMADGRWYGTATALGDGRIMVFSGLSLSGGTNNTVEIYDLKNAGAGWSSPTTAPFSPPLFPRMFLLPNGSVFFTGQGSSSGIAGSWIFQPASGTWAQSASTTADRQYGSSVLLPLLPPSYTPKIINFGGGSPATATTEMIDLSKTSPTWTPGPNMSTGRIQMNAVILPNGKLLAEGGSVNNESPDTPGKHADMYDPITNTFSSAGTASYSRLYHSTALLLPDATVASMGSNPGSRGNYEPAIEIYTPPYLFDANDNLITNRPSITGLSTNLLGYNAPLSVAYTSSSPISSAVLVRLGSSTHAFDLEQRLIGLCGPAPEPSCSGAGTLNLTTPPNGNIAPPGYYMLFLLDGAGVPSIAKFVQLSPYSTAPPQGGISGPSSDVTIVAGASVSFATTSSAAKYSWVFPGGSPATSTSQVPGKVKFQIPGIYTASLTLIDATGNSDPSPPTRTITVLPPTSDFSIAVSPSSQTVIPGQSASFTIAVTPLSGFSGTVTLGVTSESGFPAGIASGGFNPPSIAGGGTSTLTMTTTSNAAPYALSLTVTATAGSLSHTASTTLLVNLAPPALLSAAAGANQATLSWSASAGATSYHIKRALTSGGPYVSVGCTTATSFTDSGLANGTSYYYVVSADYQAGPDAGGESADTSETRVVPLASPPAAPACQLSTIMRGPPLQAQFTMQDTNSGLQSITLLDSVNVTPTIPPFASGTTTPVVVTAAQTISSQTSKVDFRVTNVAGGATTCGSTFGAPLGWTGANGNFTGHIALIRNSDGRLQAFVRGTDNTLWTIAQNAPDGQWSGWQNLGMAISRSPAVAVNSDGRLEAFVVGTDNGLWHIAQNSPGGTWGSWTSLGGALSSDPAVARNADGRLQVFGVGTDQALWTIAQISAGGSWSAWSWLGGVVSGNPAAAVDADGRLAVFVVGSDSVLYNSTQISPGGSWSAWSWLGGSLTGDPVASINADGRLQVFARGTDNALWTVSQVSAGGVWSSFTSLGGVITETPAVVSNADGRLETFVRGSDNALWHIWQTAPNSGWGSWAGLAGVLANGPSAALNQDGRVEAFVLGSDEGFWAIEQIASGSWN